MKGSPRPDLHIVLPNEDRHPQAGEKPQEVRYASVAELLADYRHQALQKIEDAVLQLNAWADVHKLLREDQSTTRAEIEREWSKTARETLKECRDWAAVFERTLEPQPDDLSDMPADREQALAMHKLIREVGETLSPDRVDQSGIDALKHLASALPQA